MVEVEVVVMESTAEAEPEATEAEVPEKAEVAGERACSSRIYGSNRNVASVLSTRATGW